VTFDATTGTFADHPFVDDNILTLLLGYVEAGATLEDVHGWIALLAEKEGYFLSGWELYIPGEEGAAGTWEFVENPGDHVLADGDAFQAVWEQIPGAPTAEFRPNNGTFNPDHEFVDDNVFTLPIPDDLPWTLANASTWVDEHISRPGYTFLGWSLEPDGVVLDDDHLVEPGSVFYAVWRVIPPPTYNFTVNINDGNQTQTITIPGEGEVIEYTITGTVPDGVEVSFDPETGELIVTGTRPEAGQPPITGTFVVTVTRDCGTVVTVTVNVNLTPLPGGGGGFPQPPIEEEPYPWREAFLIGVAIEGGERPINPSGNITRAQVATIFFRLIEDEVRYDYWEQANPFSDVVLENWFNNAISTTTNMGLFTGVGEGRFAPNQNITRGELAAVLVRFMDRDQVGPFDADSDQFSDIADHWARAYINEAAAEGWIQGYPDGTFRPGQPITRAETAAMINRIFQRLIETPDCRLYDMVTWPDNQDEDRWFFLYIYMATNSYTYRWRDDSDRYKELVEIIEPRDWTVLEQPNSRPGDILQ